MECAGRANEFGADHARCFPEYPPRYSDFQRRRLEVLPGITGWAQIHGRNTLAWEPRFECDVWYVDHWSLPLDARILARTLVCAFKRQGISAQQHSTMPEFSGRYRSLSQHPRRLALDTSGISGLNFGSLMARGIQELLGVADSD